MQIKEILLLVITVLLAIYLVFELVLVVKKRTSTFTPIVFILIIVGYLFTLLVAYGGDKLEVKDWAQIILTIGLVLVTTVYAWSTEKMSRATRIQADANVKMAKEAKEQRIMSSRPIIVPKPIHKSQTDTRFFGSQGYFMRFEIFNEGNGPAIDLEMYLLDNNKSMIEKISETILRVNDSPLKLFPSSIENLRKSEISYFVCQYQSILSRDIWYQTILPFEIVESSKKGEVYIKSKELDFFEKHEKESF